MQADMSFPTRRTSALREELITSLADLRQANFWLDKGTILT
jgi:hypothetical protein